MCLQTFWINIQASRFNLIEVNYDTETIFFIKASSKCKEQTDIYHDPVIHYQDPVTWQFMIQLTTFHFCSPYDFCSLF